MPSISLNSEERENQDRFSSINISCLTALFPTDSSASLRHLRSRSRGWRPRLYA